MKSYVIKSLFSSRAGIAISLTREEVCYELLISPELWEEKGLSPGTELSDRGAKALFLRAEMSRARARSKEILSYAGQSRQSLIAKLCAYGISETVAEATADWAEREKLMDEEGEACLLADTYHRRKYWGRKRIAQELAAKGYPETAVAAAVASVPDREYLRALTSLIEKKFGSLPTDPAERQKMVFSLLRLGYTGQEIKDALFLLSNSEEA